MFNLNNLFHAQQEDQFQTGRADREAGRLPRMKDSAYLRGYLADRPRGLDDKVQYFPTMETYLEWKQR